MALHRDIYWVGKQWAVTGYGIQACDQKQKGKFDIESSRLWEDGVLDDMRELKWLNVQDFDKAISVAREHYPEPPRKAAPRKKKAAPPQQSVSDLKEVGSKEPTSKKAELNDPGPKQPSPKKGSVEEPKPALLKFHMRVEGWPAKFVPQWRIRIKR